MIGSTYTGERTCALAGVASCCILVDQFAVSGNADAQDIRFVTEAFLNTDPEATVEILRPSNSLIPGLQLLTNLSSGQGASNQSGSRTPETTRRLSYSLQCIQLMQQLMKRDDLLQKLSAEIGNIQNIEYAEDRLLAIGSFYEQSVSTLSYRIQIKGSQGYLRQPLVAQKIRGILFCSLRFALLWQQQGGSKFDFLFRKKNIATLARESLKDRLN